MYDPTSEQIRQFAELWIEHSDPFKAGITLFPEHTQKALWAAVHWIKNDKVLAAKVDIERGEGALDRLPTKAELLRAIWDKMEACRFPEDFQKLAKLYADVRGFIEKPADGKSNSIAQSHVMLVKDHGNDDNWEKKLEQQQRTLTQANHGGD